jgi:uridine kinase
MNFSSNLWYTIAGHIGAPGSGKPTFAIGIYGKTCAGKNTFARSLGRKLEGESWHRVFLPIDTYFKVNRNNRKAMIEQAHARYGYSDEYDAAQLEAYAIDENAFASDLRNLKTSDGVFRQGVYDPVSGNHTATLSIGISRWNPVAVLVDGTLVAGLRKHCDLMIRVEAPYEVRKKRFLEKVEKADIVIPPWHFDGVERIAEKNIFGNWNIADIVVRSEDSMFTME